MLCYFVSDLHGRQAKYNTLFRCIRKEKPDAVLFGGDLLPSGAMAFSSSLSGLPGNFLSDFLLPQLASLKRDLGDKVPRMLIILGNDDGRYPETVLQQAEKQGLLEYVHNRTVSLGDYTVTGYSYVPPTPFRLKDWERYDVSRYVDHGAVSPEAGSRTVDVPAHIIRYATIADDLKVLSDGIVQEKAIWLFHSPPYHSPLDRAALDGRMIDHVPVDVHVGSMAIERFILSQQPLLTLHGHVHETVSLTRQWQHTVGGTLSFTGCHDGPELALIRFNPASPREASRELISAD